MASKGLKKLNKILRERNQLRNQHGRVRFSTPQAELEALRAADAAYPKTPADWERERIRLFNAMMEG